ncbi:MAG TPA: hypothetical protein VLA89_11135 [Gemmatimonadales bacterium]|nr:hypothetical protein [Gemmatimonadales bacterium]
MTHPYSLIGDADGKQLLTVLLPGEEPITVFDDHPHFQDILDGAREQSDPSDLRDLADLSEAVATKFDSLSERVAVAGGRVYFDGDEVEGSIVDQIVRFLDDEVEDWRPLVAFLEKVQQNPNEHSREQLYDWLKAHDFTITQEGDIVGYKGVQGGTEDGFEYASCSSGTAIVDGEVQDGQINQNLGSTVQMPRSQVQHDPRNSCSTGLHVGTFSYARSWARKARIAVLVNPRDVVSVPTDGGGEKVRVSRYTVLREVTEPITDPVLAEVTNTERDRCPVCREAGLAAADDDGDRWCDYCDSYTASVPGTEDTSLGRAEALPPARA